MQRLTRALSFALAVAAAPQTQAADACRRVHEPPPALALAWAQPALRARACASTVHTADLAASVDPIVAAAMAEVRAPGAAVAVVLNGAIVYERGYGVRHRLAGGSVTPSTVFRAGSIQKSMTAAALLQQVEAGRLWLADPVWLYTGHLATAGPWRSDRITVHDLLVHSSGIPDGVEDLDGPTGDDALARWPELLAGVHLLAPAGAFHNYSNPGYDLAGLVAERAAGLPYRRLMSERIFGAAGMSATTHDAAAVTAAGNFAWGHDGAGPGRETIVAPNAHASWANDPAGQAFTTAGDLARWAITLMSGGGAVLQPASAALLQAPLVPDLYSDASWYGYGVATARLGELEVKMHNGSYPGWGSMLIWHPPTGSAVALVSNTSDPLALGALMVLLATAPVPEPEPEPCAGDADAWRAFAGRYDLFTAIGGTLHPTAPDHLVADVTWNPAGLELALVLPTTGEVLAELPLMHACGGTFSIDYDGDGAGDDEVTFTATERPAPRRVWLRNRYMSGQRRPIGANVAR